MSTVVYQSLVSHFESQVTEATILRMKVAPAPDVGRGSCSARTDQSKNENLEIGNWSFLHSLTKIPTCPKEEMENDNSYVHRKSSFPKLNGKSLDLCTENLGSETGTECIADSTSIFSLDTFSSQCETSCPMNQQQQKVHQQMKSSRNNKMTTSCRSFPPPLTTMSGSSSLQIRAHREDGRLIIKAVDAPFRHSYLQSERSHGRLRLSFFQDYDSNFDSDLIMTTEEETEAYCQIDDEIKSELNDGEDELENEETVSEQDDDDDVHDECDVKLTETMDVEIEMQKNQRLTRCNEGGEGTEGLCNWKPAFWVATS
ncbi:protein FANTASTIC FOUR 3-like [Olea europaea var. sylvestris]|uniref:FAF domain-containing protein n=1 Tax=Olea europaea subsp. europaea TaxID=158383 RepID=A0A8S0VHL2_OLEEU|nr:protein FANTASTIC FOUR 3-like [Olea europaea var. sylvestris]CAA3031480.1 Hypothetical predicted protein [Olea europaea subsp. europaea]